ncbi:MAG TPA: hypothetical protein VG099_24595 [Gemmataceae bacterium]|jgi:hypothetical protein|nr:hypothetical protein [Gemmataceae bacterium]
MAVSSVGLNSTTDASPFKKPLLKLELDTFAPITVTARVVVQFLLSLSL